MISVDIKHHVYLLQQTWDGWRQHADGTENLAGVTVNVIFEGVWTLLTSLIRMSPRHPLCIRGGVCVCGGGGGGGIISLDHIVGVF